MIFAIFAIDESGGMGYKGKLPWPRINDDFRWFLSKTKNQVVVMGRKTWESPDMPKPLPARVNVVISSDAIDRADAVITGDVPSQLLELQQKHLDKNICVIGGVSPIVQAKPVLNVIYLTRVEGQYKCDTLIDVDELLTGFHLHSTSDLEGCKIEEYRKNETIS